MGFVTLLLVTALAGQAPAGQAAAGSSARAEQIGQAYFLYIQGRTARQPGRSGGRHLELSRRAAAAAGRGRHPRRTGRVSSRGRARRPTRKPKPKPPSRLDPTNRDGHRILGWIDSVELQRATGTAVEPSRCSTDGIAHLEKAMAGGDSADAVASAVLTLGQMYIENKQADKAVALLRQFVADHPEYPQGAALLADALGAAGKTAEAARRACESSRSRSRPSVDAAHPRGRGRRGAEANGSRPPRAGPRSFARVPTGSIYRTRYAAALANSGDLAGATAFLSALTADAPGDVDAWYSACRGRRSGRSRRRRGTGGAEDRRASTRRTRAGRSRSRSRAPCATTTRASWRRSRRASTRRPTPTSASGAFAEMASAIAIAYTHLGDHKSRHRDD